MPDIKQLIYKTIDLLTFGKGMRVRISGFNLRIPARYFRYFPPDYELDNINFISDNVARGMTVVDVGSHIGVVSIILAKKVGTDGKVFSFEPTPSTFKLLEKTIDLNKVNGTVVPINKAISEKPGADSFYITDIEAHNSNSLSNNKRTDAKEKKIEVELTSIDNFALKYRLKNIDFIKIDAEGAEYSVLKGTTNTIDKFHPKIILSLHPKSIKNFGDSLSEIWDFLSTKKYNINYQNRHVNKEWFISQSDLFDVLLT
jgi:FkbM family methyltransferase